MEPDGTEERAMRCLQQRRAREGGTRTWLPAGFPRQDPLGLLPFAKSTDIGAPQKEVPMSTVITSERTFQEAATYGGLADAIGGAATIILAIVALSGVGPYPPAAIRAGVFGA